MGYEISGNSGELRPGYRISESRRGNFWLHLRMSVAEKSQNF